MLGVAVASCSSGPEPPPCPAAGAQAGAWGPRISAQAEGCGCHLPICRFSRQRSSAHDLETHAQTHTGHGLGRTHALPQVRHCPQQYLHAGPALDMTTGNHLPSSAWAGRHKRSLVQAHTRDSLDAQAHAHSRPLCLPGTPAEIPALLPTSGAAYLLAGPA